MIQCESFKCSANHKRAWFNILKCKLKHLSERKKQQNTEIHVLTDNLIKLRGMLRGRGGEIYPSAEKLDQNKRLVCLKKWILSRLITITTLKHSLHKRENM